MTRRVPVCRPEPTASQVQAGRNVSATTTVSPLGELANFVAGNGVELVPSLCPNKTIAAGNTRDFRFWVQAPPATTRLEWSLTLRGGSATSTLASTVEVSVPTGGSARAVQVLPARGNPPIVFIEDLSAKPTAEQEIGVRIEAVAEDVIVEQIKCRTMPRFQLDADATDLGVEIDRLGVMQPIWTGTVGAVATRGASLRSIATRAGHIHFCVPDTLTDAIQITTAAPSWQALLPLDPAALARKMYRGDVSGILSYRVLYRTTVGGAGNFQISSASGGTDNVSLPEQTSFDWTDTRQFDVDCEDLSTDDGLQSATHDELTLEANQTAGTVYIAAVSVIEVPA